MSETRFTLFHVILRNTRKHNTHSNTTLTPTPTEVPVDE